MKAIVQDGYGSADVLELRDIDRPAIGAEEVLVKVRAAGLDPGVWHLMTGQPYLVRAMGFGLRRPKVAVRGRDLAGVVEAVGAQVPRVRPGEDHTGHRPQLPARRHAERHPVPRRGPHRRKGRHHHLSCTGGPSLDN